jgi:hypothetical protein
MHAKKQVLLLLSNITTSQNNSWTSNQYNKQQLLKILENPKYKINFSTHCTQELTKTTKYSIVRYNAIATPRNRSNTAGFTLKENCAKGVNGHSIQQTP